MSRPPSRRLVQLAVVGLAVGACGGAARRDPVVEFQRPTGDSYAVRTPVKAQLKDGSVILYRQGVTVTSDALQGPGTRFSLTLAPGEAVSRVPFDSVVALVSLAPLGVPKRKGLSTEAQVPLTMGIVVLLFAIFSVSGSN